MPAGGDLRSGGQEPNLLDPRRSAHASIRGYLYQTCLGVLRWLDLQPNEILVCEGDEDLDRYLLKGTVSEQVKAYAGGLSISDPVVRDSLRNFLLSYVRLRALDRERKFIFTTTAYQKKSRRDGIALNLLRDWALGARTPDVIQRVRELVQPQARHVKNNDLEDAIQWLDQQPLGWTEFMDAVEWHFDAPNLETILSEIRERLSDWKHPTLNPSDLFLEPLVIHVLKTSSHPKAQQRQLTAKDLAALFSDTNKILQSWTTSKGAARIQKAFEEVQSLDELLDDGIRELAPKNPPSKLLTAAYQVVEFDDVGRREELELLATWCGSSDHKSVLLITGAGGSGKTRLLIEWCTRLRHQVWHAGFMPFDPAEHNKPLESLINGTTPRLLVIDYAEHRLKFVRALLTKVGRAKEGKAPKLRIALLARKKESWWKDLSGSHPDVGNLLASSYHHQITPLISSRNEAEREKLFQSAAEEFAAQLGRGATVPVVPDLIRGEFEYALYLFMAALAAIDGRSIESSADLKHEALEHERQFWLRAIEDEIADVSVSNLMTAKQAVELLMASMTLTGGATKEQAISVLERVLEESDLQPRFYLSVLAIVKRLYGGGCRPGYYLEPLQPDLLGEQLVSEVISNHDDFPRRVLEGILATRPF